MSVSDDILFEEIAGVQGDIGLITLNRPQVLNSLNHAMIRALHTQLEKWKIAKHIKAILITAKPGKAFCAGGDLRFTYQNLQHVKTFFL